MIYVSDLQMPKCKTKPQFFPVLGYTWIKMTEAKLKDINVISLIYCPQSVKIEAIGTQKGQDARIK